jgi:hypothetical protein
LVLIQGGPASDPGLLATTNLLVNLTVLPANNPYGVYLFADSSLGATVAELSRSTINTSIATSVELNVTKSAGAPDYVPVSTVIFRCRLSLFRAIDEKNFA